MGVKNGVSNKAAVSRAVRLRECPLRELRLYTQLHKLRDLFPGHIPHIVRAHMRYTAREE